MCVWVCVVRLVIRVSEFNDGVRVVRVMRGMRGVKVIQVVLCEWHNCGGGFGCCLQAP